MKRCINCEYPGVNGFKTEDGKCTLCGKDSPSAGSKCEHDWNEEMWGTATRNLLKKSDNPTCPFCPKPKDSEALQIGECDCSKKQFRHIEDAECVFEDSEAVRSVEEIAEEILNVIEREGVSFKIKSGEDLQRIRERRVILIADALRHERERCQK